MIEYILYLMMALLLVGAVYLGWQATIEAPPYEAMFEVLPIESECSPPAGPPEPRFMELEGAINFRDLGGYATQTGGCIAYGKIYRAGSLHQLTDADLARLHVAGIRVVCDLRSVSEAKSHPDRLPAGAAYLHFPVYVRDPIGGWRAVFQRHRLDQLFKHLYSDTIIDRGAPVVGRLIRLAADPGNLPMVIHCTRGKDRTGVAAALILHICGVPRKTIVADYTLTNLSTDEFIAATRKAYAAIPRLPGFKLEQFYPLMSARAELIERAFTHIEACYGSVEAYLLGPLGLTTAELDAIRGNLIA